MSNSQLTTHNSTSPSLPPSLSPQTKGVIIIEGHVQGLANTRALVKEGIPVYVVDKDNCVARYSRYCKKYFRCPDYQSDEFIDFLIDLHKKEDLEEWLLLPSNDNAVYNIAKHKQRLGKLFRIITEDLKIIEKIYNKRDLLQLAERIGVAIPATFFPEKSNPKTVNLRYPLLIRGNNGLSFARKYRTKVVVLEDDCQLTGVFNEKLKGINPEEYFIQEILPEDNKTISVALFAEKGIILTYWMGIKLREHPERFGTATCCKSVYIEELLEPSKRLMKELNYTGVCEIEFIRDSRDGLYKLIEINARTWLWVDLAIRCGVNFPKIIYDYVYQGIIPEQAEYRLNEIWLNIYTDLVYTIKPLIKRKRSIKHVAKTYKKFNEACWDKGDFKPFFAYGILIPYYLSKRT